MGESFHPAGDHIPMVLSRIYFEDQARWVGLKKSLEEFGRASGLFRGLNVRPLGRRSAGDPFQVTVRISGLSNSLLDVGYGVSQALPIVVEALRTESARTLLRQQPEVHLHPRAQAELGSLLTSLVHLREKRFIVETHSDQLIDRVRMDVRDGKIESSMVKLLFFERRRGEVQIVPMTVDKSGNLKGAPKTYRQFFLNEELRFMGA